MDEQFKKTPREGFPLGPVPSLQPAAPAPRKVTLRSVATWVTLATAALALAEQVAGIWRPDLVGPIRGVLQLLGGLQ